MEIEMKMTATDPKMGFRLGALRDAVNVAFREGLGPDTKITVVTGWSGQIKELHFDTGPDPSMKKQR